MKRFKIVGRLNGAYPNKEGDLVEITKTVYARFEWTKKIKILFMQIFYDWVEVTEER